MNVLVLEDDDRSIEPVHPVYVVCPIDALNILYYITIYLPNTCQNTARRNHSVITELLPLSSPHACMYVCKTTVTYL